VNIVSIGIIVFGASGSGTTTLGRGLAMKLGITHFDLDDYFWHWDTPIPFTVSRQKEERVNLLMKDISVTSGFVMSGNICGWDESFVPLFELAVFVTAPSSVRLARLHTREASRFGARIQPGGDMYDEHKKFLTWAGNYDTMEPPQRCIRLHEEWAAALPCPCIRIDGTAAISESIAQIIKNVPNTKRFDNNLVYAVPSTDDNGNPLDKTLICRRAFRQQRDTQLA